MKRGNLIYIIGGLGILYYFLSRKNNVTIPQNGDSTIVDKVYTYPMGLKELDLIANSVEISQLYKGQKRPLTAAYVNTYLPNSWERTITIPDIVYQDIPTGAVLDI